MGHRFETKLFSGLIGLLMGSAAFASEVQLRSPDGAIGLRGELMSVDDSHFVVRTEIGDIKVERARVECLGAACPQVETIAAGLTVRGSDTIGDELMPLLLEGYAESLGAATADHTSVGSDTIAMTLNSDDGFGDELVVAKVQAAGSSTGLRALINDETDIAMSSRPARSKEIVAIARQGRGNIVDLSQEYIIAVDSILAIVSPENPVTSLTTDQLAAIFAGQITNWNQVGGPNLPITVVTRPDTSGTRGVFENAILAPLGLTMSPRATVLGSNDDITSLVTETPGAIGYTGFAYKNGTKGLDLVSSCGIKMQATAFSAKTEEYPLQRRLRLFIDNQALAEHTRGLLDFAVSESADPFVNKAGFIDLSVESDARALDTQHIYEMASLGGEPAAYTSLGRMVSELTGAERLSTTFRFITGSSQLDNKSLRDLSRMVNFLKRPENAGREIIVAGYTDSVGNYYYNEDLSLKRAQAVTAALYNEAAKQGLNGLNMRAAGYSELSPVGCNDTELGKSRNRRVEIWIR